MTGGTSIEVDEEEEDSPYLSEDEPYASDSEPYAECPSSNTKASKRKTKTTAIKTRRPRQGTRKMTFSSEGELFDSDGISSVYETSPRKRGRPPKAVSSTSKTTLSSEGELFDFDGASSTDGTPSKRGRPPKAVSSTTRIPSEQTKTPVSSSRRVDGSQHPTFGPIDVSSEGESFDSDCASLDGTSVKPSKHLPIAVCPDVSIPVLPRKRGRPRKVPPNADLIPASSVSTTTRAASEKSQIGSKNYYSTAARRTGGADLNDEILDFNVIRPSEDGSMQRSPYSSSRETSRGLQSKLPGGLGSMNRAKIIQPRRVPNSLRGQEVESVDTINLTRAMSSMFVSSPGPRYIEISD
ncbi:hypothetical protein C0993_006701 [Termitomyces sp. T159_Od127]|nr:hypothetical protein C0993_006701 [Termitomyces sp. T159_Od127]